MGRRFLITGTGVGVGKTTVGCALGFAIRARGMRVGVMKPIDSVESQDVQALALAVGSTIPLDLLCPYRYRSAIERDRLPAPELAHIARCFSEIAAHNDVMLVESASMINFADLGAMLNLEVIVVVGNRPGCRDATTLALQGCDSRGIKVAGCVLCDCDPATETDEASLQTLLGVRYLGRMRHREPLARTIVEKLV
jgi:dethiobiotin synthetase